MWIPILSSLSVILMLIFLFLSVISVLRKKKDKVKKNLMLALGSFLFLVGIIVAIPYIENNGSEQATPTTGTTISEEDQTDVSEENTEIIEEDESTETSEEDTQKEEIQSAIEKIVKEDLNNTTFTQVDVNKNAGLDDGSYVVLPHLVWDTKNNPKRTREMLEMYSDHLAAKLADYKVSEITVFWEVPYHLEGSNAAKFNYEKQGEEMAIGERWYDQGLRE